MDDFDPGNLGYIEVWLIGGPLDGIAYDDMPLFPGGEPGHSVAIPLDDVGQPGAFASYVRREHPALDGRWYYDYKEVTTGATPLAPVAFPTGTTVGVSSAMPDGGSTGVADTWSPAPRFVLAQAWWIASELCRRDPRLRILDAWPMGGFYHGLEVGERLNHDHVFMNFLGRIHLIKRDEDSPEPVPWSRTLAAESPHEIVKLIEGAMGWQHQAAPATTPRTLVYRLIAATLSAHIDDRERWGVAAAYCYGGFEDWPALLDEYQGCRTALQKDTGTETPASTRVWVLTRGGVVASLLSDMGLRFSTDAAPVNLMAEYRKRRRLEDVLPLVTR